LGDLLAVNHDYFKRNTGFLRKVEWSVRQDALREHSLTFCTQPAGRSPFGDAYDFKGWGYKNISSENQFCLSNVWMALLSG
jgi:hypothetical protein